MDERSNIPLFYPVRIAEMELAATEVIRSGQIASGPAIEQFESAFGEHIGRPHVVATNDMTSAMVLALKLAGVKFGDSVATLAFSCLSTNSAISIVGAKPVWIDIQADTVSMSPQDLSKKISSEIKAVLLYHVAGYPANLKSISSICKAHNIPLIEDCNNALGASVDGCPIGSVGQFAVYSFYPNRQINGLEGGALVCPDESTAQHAKKLRRFGINYSNFRDKRGEINPNSDVPEIGISAAFTNLNASVAYAQLPTLAHRLDKVKNNADQLSLMLIGNPQIQLIKLQSCDSPAYWCFLILVKRRDDLLLSLKEKGIQCSIMHTRNDNYSGFHTRQQHLPGTEYVMNHVLAIPCGWWLRENDIIHIAESIIIENQKL